MSPDRTTSSTIRPEPRRRSARAPGPEPPGSLLRIAVRTPRPRTSATIAHSSSASEPGPVRTPPKSKINPRSTVPLLDPDRVIGLSARQYVTMCLVPSSPGAHHRPAFAGRRQSMFREACVCHVHSRAASSDPFHISNLRFRNPAPRTARMSYDGPHHTPAGRDDPVSLPIGFDRPTSSRWHRAGTSIRARTGSPSSP